MGGTTCDSMKEFHHSAIKWIVSTPPVRYMSLALPLADGPVSAHSVCKGPSIIQNARLFTTECGNP